jgi:hypothetical protein
MILALMAAPAAAATFDFASGDPRRAAGIAMVSDGIGLTLRGSDTSGARDLDLTLGGGRGLGIAGTGDSDPWASQIESWGASAERLHLSFDRAVRIEAITFTWTDFDDRVGLSGAGDSATFKPGPSGVLVLGGGDWTGTQFTLAPETWTFCTWYGDQNMCEARHSGFRVSSIEVSNATAVVPLPASVLMLSGALAGLGAVAWRRTKVNQR